MQGRSKSQWQGPSNESGLSVYWAIGNQAGQQLESHDDVVDYGDDDDVVDDDDDDLNTMQRRVAEVVRGHGGPPPKSLDLDENFKPEHMN